MSLSSKINNIKLDINKPSIDDEWSSFITNSCDNDEVDIDLDIDDLKGDKYNDSRNTCANFDTTNVEVPEPTEIYISTKSKIAYLTNPVDLTIFWDIPIIPYATAKNGVIKKQIKINSKTPEELDTIQQKLQQGQHR